MIKFSVIGKFLRIVFASRKTPHKPLVAGRTDITLSVWNVFHSREQRRAFEDAGLSVHWIGNHFPPTKDEVYKRSISWISFLVLMLSFFAFRKEWVKHLSMTLFDLYSGSRRLNTRLVWAYCEMNTRLIRKANKKGIPVILDNPIAHMRDYYEILKPEYEVLGLEFHDSLIRKWTEKVEYEYAHADYFMAGSSFVKDSLIRRGVNPEKIFVAHYGVDTNLWKESYEKRRNKKSTDMVFVFTANISLRKGLQYLLRAWKKANLSHARLLICGGGSLPYEKIIHPMPENISFMGSCRHVQLKEIYSKADVFVLPSLLEGFVRSGLEAMATGLPVIITKETGLTDFCNDGEHGWIVPARNEDALADRLRWCYEHPREVREAGEKAYFKLQNNTFEGYGAQCVAIAKQIIKDSVIET